MSRKEFFNYIGFTDTEYDHLVHKCAGILIADVERIIACVYTVVKCGYPLEDIDSLIMLNPYFMLDNPKNLEKKLLGFGDDLESKIKADPYIV